MLQPDNRAAFTEALRPPPGYRLVHAVGTTFTLDLTSALLVPLNAMGARLAGSDTDTRTAAMNPIAIMEAARSAAAKIDLFCQCGAITVPPAPGLVSLLEPMIHPVTLKQPANPLGRHRLFHPKFWLLHFSDGSPKDNQFRFICSSRNLTADTSWDAVVVLDGYPGRRNTANDPVRDLLQRLPGWAINPLPVQRQRDIADLAESLADVAWEPPDGIDDIAFRIYGPHKRTKPPSLAGRRQLIISPFVTDTGLGQLVGSQTTVLSRPNQLDRLSPEMTARFEALVPDDDLALTAQSEAHDDPSAVDIGASLPAAGTPVSDADQSRTGELAVDELSGLHAKAYVVDRGNVGGHRTSCVYLGSANATESGFGGNVELLVELTGASTQIGVDATIGQLLAGPFAAYRPTGGETPSEEEESVFAVWAELRKMAGARLVATVTSGDSESGQYWLDVDATVDLDGANYLATAHPIGAPGVARPLAAGGNNDVRFGPLDLISITPFFVVTLTERQGPDPASARCVVQAELLHDPAERLDAIAARQLDTAEKFYQYLMLMLARDAEQSAEQILVAAGVTAFDVGFGQPGLFESLLRTLGAGNDSTPQTIREIDRVLTRLAEHHHDRELNVTTGHSGADPVAAVREAIVPDGFEALWASIREAYGRPRKVVRRG